MKEYDLITHGLACREAQTWQDLEGITLRFLLDRGVGMVSYRHIAPLGTGLAGKPISVHSYGFPEAWIHRYANSRLYDIDPIPRLSQARTRPFRWLDLSGSGELTAQEATFLEILEEEGLANGLAVPVFGPHGRNGYCGLGYKSAGDMPTREGEMLLSLVCHQFHWRYCELRPLPRLPARLSQREKETLRLMAKGASNIQIAEEMGVTTSTVDTNVRRCFQKLGVNDRISAVLRAIVEGVYD